MGDWPGLRRDPPCHRIDSYYDWVPGGPCKLLPFRSLIRLAEAAPPDFRNMPEESIPDEVRSWFNSIAAAQGWACSTCGETIQVEDRDVYFRTGRCLRCESILKGSCP